MYSKNTDLPYNTTIIYILPTCTLYIFLPSFTLESWSVTSVYSTEINAAGLGMLSLSAFELEGTTV